MPRIQQPTTLRARIGEVITTGPRPYVVAYPANEAQGRGFGIDERESITFDRSFLPPETSLSPGQLVELDDIVRHARGWRAGKVQLIAPAGVKHAENGGNNQGVP